MAAIGLSDLMTPCFHLTFLPRLGRTFRGTWRSRAISMSSTAGFFADRAEAGESCLRSLNQSLGSLQKILPSRRHLLSPLCAASACMVWLSCSAPCNGDA